MTGQALLILPGILAVFIAVFLIWGFARRYRRELGVAKTEHDKTTDTSFIINAFHKVTRELKDKEKELERLKAIAEQRAENFESYNENILQCVTSGVVTFDAGCRLTTINRAAEETLCVTKGEVAGKTCLELFGNGEISRAVHTTLEGHVPSARLEDRLERSGGGLWLGFNTAVLSDRQNAAICSLGCRTPISLFAAIIETRQVSCVIAGSSVAGSRRPFGPTGKISTRNPLRAK